MINIQITSYRNETPEEKESRLDFERKNGYRNSGFNETDLLTPHGKEMRQERILSTELTEEQFEAIRKAVIDKF